MTKPLAPLAVNAFSIEDDPELVAIAASLSETAAYAINPAFKEDLRKELLCQLREHCLATQAEEATTSTDQANVQHERPQQRDALILFFLDTVDALLHRYAALARLDYDDLRQDACILIMNILDQKPEKTHTRAYIYVAVRSRIIDKIRYNQGHQAESLDVPASGFASNKSIGDLLPSGYSIDPLLVVLEKEARRQAKEALRSLPAKRLKTKRVQRAIALFEEEVL